MWRRNLHSWGIWQQTLLKSTHSPGLAWSTLYLFLGVQALRSFCIEFVQWWECCHRVLCGDCGLVRVSGRCYAWWEWPLSLVPEGTSNGCFLCGPCLLHLISSIVQDIGDVFCQIRSWRVHVVAWLRQIRTCSGLYLELVPIWGGSLEAGDDDCA